VRGSADLDQPVKKILADLVRRRRRFLRLLRRIPLDAFGPSLKPEEAAVPCSTS
jgi:hypothetical protein